MNLRYLGEFDLEATLQRRHEVTIASQRDIYLPAKVRSLSLAVLGYPRFLDRDTMTVYGSGIDAPDHNHGWRQQTNVESD